MPTHASNRPADPVRRHPGVLAVFVVLCASLIAGDLLLKWWSFARLPAEPVSVAAVLNGTEILPHIEQPVIPHVLTLKLTLNQGAVFGVGQGQTWVFIVITLIAIGVVSAMFAVSGRRDHIAHIMLMLILAGAVGNLVDRSMYAAVRDMLWLFPEVALPFGWHWPGFLGGGRELYPWVFNLADVYLVLGVVILILRSLFGGRSSKNAAQAGSDAQGK